MAITVLPPLALRLLALLLVFSAASLPAQTEGAYEVTLVTTVVDGEAVVSETDGHFVCATLDWRSAGMCRCGSCTWNHASILNLNLSTRVLLNAVKEFSPLKLRLGGSLEDMVTYQTDPDQICNPFVANASAYFGYSDGCLSLARWDELHEFFNKTGAAAVFGLNALNGRITLADGSLGGPWNHTNAESLIRYTAKKGYSMLGWEFGNELGGRKIKIQIHAAQYAEDVIKLKCLMDQIYQGLPNKPLVIAPASNYEENWFGEFIDLTKASNSVDVITHHLYSLGAGKDEDLVTKILDPLYLDGASSTFSNLSTLIKRTGTSAVAWVGEAGGAYNGGHHLVTDSFVSSFWYLDQLALTAKYGTKTYCRQSLIGECYGLLDTNTFKPNPDYYSALLWHRLMGPKVLSVNFNGSNMIRIYAHCAKHSEGITLLLLNLDQKIGAQVQVSSKINSPSSGHSRGSIREEYHLTAEGGNLHSQTMLLNGEALLLNSLDEIPALMPIKVHSSQPINVAPLSIVFTHIPSFHAPACL